MPRSVHFREQIHLAAGFDNRDKAIILTLCATLFRVMAGWALGLGITFGSHGYFGFHR
jgi:hypothetical protein